MNFSLVSAVACTLLVAAASQAGEGRKSRIEIAIDDDTTGEQSFVFDSEDAGFDLQSMLVDESRNITDRFGNTADLRRMETGFELDLNGKTIEIPTFEVGDMPGLDGIHDEHEVRMLIGDSDKVVVTDIDAVRVLKSDSIDGITIISGSEVDAATRERIEEALSASGRDAKVTYIDGSDLHDDEHQANRTSKVRIIKKRVDVTN